jgi:hypothetical protein
LNMDGDDLTEEQRKEAVRVWNNGAFHPLTCGMDSSHAELEYDDGGLICPTCGYRQNYVPSIIFSYYAREVISTMAGHAEILSVEVVKNDQSN